MTPAPKPEQTGAAQHPSFVSYIRPRILRGSAAARLLTAFYRLPQINDSKQAYRSRQCEDVFVTWLQATLPGWSAVVDQESKAFVPEGLDEFQRETFLWGDLLAQVAWVYSAYAAAGRSLGRMGDRRATATTQVRKTYQKAFRQALLGVHCAFPREEMGPLVAGAVAEATRGVREAFRILFSTVTNAHDALEFSEELFEFSHDLLVEDSREVLGPFLEGALMDRPAPESVPRLA